jgi:hypothetical protein
MAEQPEEKMTKNGNQGDNQNGSVHKNNDDDDDDDDDSIEVVFEPRDNTDLVNTSMTNKRSANKQDEQPPTKRAKRNAAEVIEID